MFGLWNKKKPVDRQLLLATAFEATFENLSGHYQSTVHSKGEIALYAAALTGISIAYNNRERLDAASQEIALFLVNSSSYIGSRMSLNPSVVEQKIRERWEEYAPAIDAYLTEEQSPFSNSQIAEAVDRNVIKSAYDEAEAILRGLNVSASINSSLEVVGRIYSGSFD